MSLQRDDSIDAVCGLLILIMIFYHCLQWANLSDSIAMNIVSYFGFFMPWFFFKSGMFFHKDIDVLIEIKKGFYRLIIPFIKWSVIGWFIYCLRICIEGDDMWMHYVLTPLKSLILSGSVSGNPPLWFLLTLFLVRVSSCFILKIKNQFALFILMAMCLLTAYILNKINCRFVPLYFANSLTGLFFFVSGYCLKEEQQSSRILFLSSLILYGLFCICGLSIVDMRTNSITSGFYFLWPICAISGVVVINNIFRVTCHKIKYSILIKIGKNSLSIFVVHWLIIELAYILNGILNFESKMLFFISCMANIVLVLIVLCYKHKND